MPRHSLLIIGAICILVTAHLLIQHNVMNNPLEPLGALPRQLHSYLENRRLRAPFRGSLKWRQLMYGPYTGDKTVWTAPLECNGGPDPEFPDRYTVYLHRGYDLLQHKHTLQGLVDLDQAIDPETPAYSGGTLFEQSYSAHLNETALAAVRADLGVDIVACERTVQADMGLESNSTLTDEEHQRMTEYADCLVRLREIAAGAYASEEEKETLEQSCGPMPTWDWRQVPEFQ